MEKEIKWIKTFFLTAFFILFSIILFNILIDPFGLYRISKFICFNTENEIYLNGTLIKHFKPNSLILGTSMVENFIISEVEDKLGFKNCLKLSLSGSTIYQQSLMFNYAKKYNHIDEVLWGIDIFSFSKKDNKLYKDFPYYLYNNKIIDDYKYLLSPNTTKTSIKNLLKYITNKNSICFDMNRMYEWQHVYEGKFKEKLL